MNEWINGWIEHLNIVLIYTCIESIHSNCNFTFYSVLLSFIIAVDFFIFFSFLVFLRTTPCLPTIHTVIVIVAYLIAASLRCLSELAYLTYFVIENVHLVYYARTKIVFGIWQGVSRLKTKKWKPTAWWFFFLFSFSRKNVNCSVL